MSNITYELGNTPLVKLLSGQGFTPYNNGAYVKPTAYFNTALASELNDSDTLNEKGSDLSDLGDDTAAIEYYDRALVIEPNHVDSLYDKARSLNRLGNITEAIEYYDRALAIDPDHADVLNNKGNIFRGLGNYTEAIESYDRALAVEPKHTLALTNKGISLYHLGNYTEAIEYYDKELAIDPAESYALTNKGMALNDLGRPNQAIVYFDKAIAIEPNSTSTLFNKGISLYDLGNDTGAMEYRDKVLDPNYIKALRSKGDALFGSGNFTGAIDVYNRILATDPNNADVQRRKVTAQDKITEDIEISKKTDTAFSLYENPSLGIKIQYPYDWEWKHNYYEVHFSFPQDDAGFQVVVSVYPTLNRSLDQFIMNMPERFLPNFGFIESPKKITLGLYPARMMVYNFTNDEIDVKAMQVLLQREDKTYSIAYVAEPTKYNDYLPTIEKMINSFETTALTAKQDFLTYYNSTYGVAIQYPSSWIKDERGDGSDDCFTKVVEFKDPSWNAQLMIYIQYNEDDIYEDHTLEEILELELEWYRDYKNPDFYDDFRVIESNINSTLAGHPAYKLEYSQKAGVTEYNSMQTGTVINSDAYYITADVKAENYSANFPTVRKMIDSFKMEELKDFVCSVRGEPPVPTEDTNKTSTELKPDTEDTNKTSTELKPDTEDTNKTSTELKPGTM